MSVARQVVEGSFYLVTRRCTQRLFLLRPDDSTNNAFLYCLIDAAQRYDIDLLMTCAMSNHYHSVIYDRHGRYPEFLEHFHKLLARSQNCLRGRWENMWASEQASVVKLVTRDAVIDKIVYAATNPVKDSLVERVHHWPGVNALNALRSGKLLRATRPKHFFRSNGPMPDALQLALTIPESLGPAASLIDEVERRVRDVERACVEDRARTGGRVLGRKAVLEQCWWDAPTTVEPRRTLSPRVASRNTWARVEALLRDREFADAYREARRDWSLGLEAIFPVGTYWLRRFANVPIATA
jgi:REP element-mobilizing transposase RayT